jgi:cytochrome P450
LEFDIMDPKFLHDPFSTYRWLLEEAPVYHSAQYGWWAVSRYDDVTAVLKDHKTFISGQGVGPVRDREPGPRGMLDADPPDHTRMRTLVVRAFTPRMVANFEPRIREIVNILIDDALAKGSLELVDDLSAPLPVWVISEMLGAEPGMWRQIKAWADPQVIRPTPPTPEEEAVMEETATAYKAYIQTLIDARRKERKDDLISALVAAQEDQDKLTDDEIMENALLLLTAGHETTVNLISNAILTLCQWPDQFAKLRARPELAESTVEEVMRYDGPVQSLFRVTTRDVEVAGVTIPNDEQVLVQYGAANRDPRQFPNPDVFDIERSPNRQVGFGLGIHFCLGAPLARLETKIVLEEIVKRFSDLQLDPDNPPVRNDNPIMRGLFKLPLRYEIPEPARLPEPALV